MWQSEVETRCPVRESALHNALKMKSMSRVVGVEQKGVKARPIFFIGLLFSQNIQTDEGSMIGK